MAAGAALREELVDRAGIALALRTAIGWPWVRRARDVLALADARAESPLESITRLALHDSGFPAPQLQVCFGDDRVDFYWPTYGLVLEADGRIKYVGDAGWARSTSDERLSPGVVAIPRARAATAPVKRTCEASRVLRVLIDADNVAPRRVQPVLDLLSACPDVRITASGRASALERLELPDGTEILEHAGWQRADLALAEAYEPSTDPLILVTGDGDFGLLATRHPGPVLVISGAASERLRGGTTVVDPATEGTGPIESWLTENAT